MSKRSYPSGAEKRKIAAKQQKSIDKLPKLTSFFTSSVPSINDPLIAGDQQSVVETLERSSQPQLDTNEEIISGEEQSAADLENSSEPQLDTNEENDKNKTTVEEEIALKENTSNDPADYLSEIRTEKICEFWISKGPTFFHNRDCDFSEAAISYKESSGRYKVRSLSMLIDKSLTSIAQNTEQAQETRNEAFNLHKKMEKLEFLILIEVWSSLLSMINKTNISLQQEQITLDVATNLLTALTNFISSVRDKYDQFESSAKEKNPEAEYADLLSREKSRSSRMVYFDGPAAAVNLKGKEKFKVETFFEVIDNLTTNLQYRLSKYKVINDRFGFLVKLTILNEDNVAESCQKLAQIYYKDISEEFVTECFHLAEYLKIDKKDKNYFY